MMSEFGSDVADLNTTWQIRIQAFTRIVLTQFCESGSGESVINRPPRSGSGNSELRIRIQS
jgi:hypothetical protein